MNSPEQQEVHTLSVPWWQFHGTFSLTDGRLGHTACSLPEATQRPKCPLVPHSTPSCVTTALFPGAGLSGKLQVWHTWAALTSDAGMLTNGVVLFLLSSAPLSSGQAWWSKSNSISDPKPSSLPELRCQKSKRNLEKYLSIMPVLMPRSLVNIPSYKQVKAEKHHRFLNVSFKF